MAKKLYASGKVYVSRSGISKAGRGVFASRNIKKGGVIETCPIIKVPRGDVSNYAESVLVTYFFYFGKNKQRIAIALGFGSIYNHSINPNISYNIKPKAKIIEFVALKDIKKDVELTFDYYNRSNKSGRKDPLWFEK